MVLVKGKTTEELVDILHERTKIDNHRKSMINDIKSRKERIQTLRTILEADPFTDAENIKSEIKSLIKEIKNFNGILIKQTKAKKKEDEDELLTLAKAKSVCDTIKKKYNINTKQAAGKKKRKKKTENTAEEPVETKIVYLPEELEAFAKFKELDNKRKDKQKLESFIRNVRYLQDIHNKDTSNYDDSEKIAYRFNVLRCMNEDRRLCPKMGKLYKIMDEVRVLMKLDAEFDIVYKSNWVRFVFNPVLDYKGIDVQYNNKLIIGCNEHGFVITYNEEYPPDAELIAFEATKAMVLYFIKINDINIIKSYVLQCLAENNIDAGSADDIKDIAASIMAFKLIFKECRFEDVVFILEKSSLKQTLVENGCTKINFTIFNILSKLTLEDPKPTKTKLKENKESIKQQIQLKKDPIYQKPTPVPLKAFEEIYPLPRVINMSDICTQLHLITRKNKFEPCMEQIFVAYGGTKISKEFKNSVENGLGELVMKFSDNVSVNNENSTKMYDKYNSIIQRDIYPLYQDYLDARDSYNRDKAKFSILNILYVLSYTGDLSLTQMNTILNDADVMAKKLNKIELAKKDTSILISHNDKILFMKSKHPKKIEETAEEYNTRINNLINEEYDKKYDQKHVVHEVEEPVDQEVETKHRKSFKPKPTWEPNTVSNVSSLISESSNRRPSPLDPFLSPDHRIKKRR